MLSIVIPARNLATSILTLIEETRSILAEMAFEIVVVDDGSTDGMADVVAAHGAAGVRVVRHRAARGASAAIYSGVAAASYPIVCVLDGDARIPPWNIEALLRSLREAGPEIGLVLGRRPAAERGGLSQWAWVTLRRAVLRDGTLDPACGIRLFRREAFLALPYFDDMQFYLAALFLRDGWRVRHVDVDHRALGPKLPPDWARVGPLRAVANLLGVLWLRRRRNAVAVDGRMHGA